MKIVVKKLLLNIDIKEVKNKIPNIQLHLTIIRFVCLTELNSFNSNIKDRKDNIILWLIRDIKLIVSFVGKIKIIIKSNNKVNIE